MGSSTERRKKDIASPRPIIRLNDLADSGGANRKEFLNESCPAAKKIKLSNNKLVNGQKLYLRLNGEIVSIFAGSTKIQDVTGELGKKLNYCLKSGVSYFGNVKNGYGEFQRTA